MLMQADANSYVGYSNSLLTSSNANTRELYTFYKLRDPSHVQYTIIVSSAYGLANDSQDSAGYCYS
jgi:hypothetical protein